MTGAPGPLLLDLDGVLRRRPAEDAADAEAAHGLPAGSLLATVRGGADLLDESVTGWISDERWRAEVADRYAADHGPRARDAIARWSRSPGRVDADVLAVVRDERHRRPVHLATNATTRLRADLAALGLDREVDGVLSSAELGVAKPDPGFWRAACDVLEVEPSACCVVDDTAENVAAAAALGMATHLFRGVGPLRAFLARGAHG